MKFYRVRADVVFEVQVPDDAPAGRVHAERHMLELWYELAERHPEIAAGMYRVKTVKPLKKGRR